MRAVVQRVRRANVTIADEVVGAIEHGLLVLLGVPCGATTEQVDWLAEKIVNLRIFDDEAGKMNRSVQEVGGGILIVSQFTLYGDCRKGRRPSFVGAAPPTEAEPLYERFLAQVRKLGMNPSCGRFGAAMQVGLINAGPVTLIIDAPV